MDATPTGGRFSSLTSNRLLIPAAIPFLLSFVFCNLEALPNTFVESNSRPALSFDQYMVNLGLVGPSRHLVDPYFAFTNTSDKTVTVKDLIPSCGCLNPRLEKKVYKPGESGAFHLVVDTTLEQPGEKEYWVRMLYEDPQPQAVTLTFKVSLPQRKVIVQPRALLIYTSSTMEPQEVIVTDYRVNKLNITGVSSSSKYIRPRIGRVETDTQGNKQMYLSVGFAEKLPPAKMQAVVRIHTDDPDFPLLKVPLMIMPRSSPVRQAGHESPK